MNQPLSFTELLRRFLPSFFPGPTGPAALIPSADDLAKQASITSWLGVGSLDSSVCSSMLQGAVLLSISFS